MAESRVQGNAAIPVSAIPRWAQSLLALDSEASAFANFAGRCRHRSTGKDGSPICSLNQAHCGPVSCRLFGKQDKAED